MRIHPDIARLREGALPPQPRTDRALAGWRARTEVAAALAELPRFAEGGALARLPALARLLQDGAVASAFTAALTGPLMAALAAEPLAQLQLGHSGRPGLARLRLAGHGRAALTLTAFALRARAMPQAAVFEDGTAHEIVVAGEGAALVHQLAGTRPISCEVTLAPGTRLKREGADEARQIIAVTRPLLVLQLTREPAAPAPSREIALADGRVIQTICGCKATSQAMMALGVLGALRHPGAVPAMAALARETAAARDLRWEALRQCLALDARAGLALLAELASDPDDALAAPAAALQARLCADRPELAGLIAEPA